MTLATAARTLPDDQRSRYERAVLEGRAVAERAVDAALRSLVPLPPAIQHMLTALGGDWSRLVEEAAYTQWHRVLFARFLIENDLLMNEDEISLSLDDCAEIAHDENKDEDAWDVAARHASAMLPGIFRPGDPLAALQLAAEHRAEMQRIVAGMPQIIFTSSDSLGWSYQYWQKNRKDQVNASEVKIGGAELPAVTQLFTEPYMVDFLVQNTLGAWWATRRPDSPLVHRMEFLRRDDDGVPLVGTFDEWPDAVAEITAIDPCCGSGHFLATMFRWLRLMRMEEESLDDADAGDAVLRENLFGLELDARCIQIAHFNLAMHAWLEGGYRKLPAMNLACTGMPVTGTLSEWLLLAKGDTKLEGALTKLHKLLENAEHLGSLMNPNREAGGDLLTAELDQVMPVLEQALAGETKTIEEDVYLDDLLDAWDAVRLLSARYWLVLTNVPYLLRRRQSQVVSEFIDARYRSARADIATAMLSRIDEMLVPGGVSGTVSPSNWLALGTYEAFRSTLLENDRIRMVIRLGSGAFSSISGEVVKPVLAVMDRSASTAQRRLYTGDASSYAGASEKARSIGTEALTPSSALEQLSNADARIVDGVSAGLPQLAKYSSSLQGTTSGDQPRYLRKFWEVGGRLPREYRGFHEGSPSGEPFAGMSNVIQWFDGTGGYHASAGARVQGQAAWGKRGVIVNRTGRIAGSLYMGDIFDMNAAVLVPNDPSHLPAIWSYVSSAEYEAEVRRLDVKLNVTNATMAKVPFDLARWQQIAAEKYPAGLPEPHSDDPTQWLFKGSPSGSDHPLHVAVARLVGFRWPAQFNDDGEAISDSLDELADPDGIVCLPSVNGELPAVDRLRVLLEVAYGNEWDDGMQSELLRQVEFSGKTLSDWLRAKKGFAAQHNKLFHNRPFIWQITDGAKDGFSALVNYHKLDRANLDRLVHTYLQDWIVGQQAALDAGEPGADIRLAKATELKSRLEMIAEGKPPYDIYARWNRNYYLSLAAAPSWAPDLDDGVRMNIRPFVTAGVLHSAPNVNWKKDRGKDADGSERHNDLHFGAYEVPES